MFLRRYPRAFLLLLLTVGSHSGSRDARLRPGSARPRRGIPGRSQGRPEGHRLGTRGPFAPGRRLGGRDVPVPSDRRCPRGRAHAGAVETLLRDLLGKDYLVNPQVSVSVQDYRSQRVFVLGEVEKPGTYAMTGQTTLLDVLSQAGGPSKNAGRQVVVVRFPASEGPVIPGAAGSVTLRANLKRLLDGDGGENITLQNGDTVFVPKLTSFFVLGEVLRQGAYAMEKETSALEAVTLAGGFTDRAAPSGAKILRKGPDGAQDTIEIDLTDPKAREVHLRRGRHAARAPRQHLLRLGRGAEAGRLPAREVHDRLRRRDRRGRVHREGRPEPGEADPAIAHGAGADRGAGPLGCRPGRPRLRAEGWRHVADPLGEHLLRPGRGAEGLAPTSWILRRRPSAR